MRPDGPSSWRSSCTIEMTGGSGSCCSAGSSRMGVSHRPLLDGDRYVYLECSMPALLAVARGRCAWSDRFEDGSITAAGAPVLLSRVVDWFEPASGRPNLVRRT